MRLKYTLFALIISLQSLSQDLILETAIQTGHYEKITAIKYSADGQFLYSASEDLTIKLWELSTGREIRTFMGPERAVQYIDISPDGNRMITVSQDGTAWIWDVRTGKEVIQLRDTADFITNAIYSQDGKSIITAGKKYSAVIWDVLSQSITQRLEGIGLSCLNSICSADLSISKNGRFLSIGLQDFITEIWDLKSFELKQSIKSRRSSCSSCVVKSKISPDGNLLVTSYGSDSIKVWQIADSTRTSFQTSVEEADKIQLTRDGQYIAAVDGGVISVLGFPSGQVIWQHGNYSSNNIETFDFSPSGKTISVGGSNKEIEVLDAKSGKPLKSLMGYASVQEDSLKGTVRFWAKNLLKQDISPDGELIAEPKGNYVIVWELSTGRVIKKLGDGNAGMVAAKFSPDGTILATAGGDRVLRLWNTTNWELIRSLKGHTGTILCLEFSNDSQYVVSGGWDYMTFIWNVENGNIYGRYKIHENGSPVAVSFMPGDLYLITGGLDQRLKMTDVDTGEEVRDLVGHRTHVVALDYSPDGKYLLG
jgi:WD40 repeat protein